MENTNKIIDGENADKLDLKKKKHNSALLAVAKARGEAVHKSAHSYADGLHPIGTNITYKKGGSVL